MQIPKDFLAQQENIAKCIILEDKFKVVKSVAGADVAFDKNYAYGAFVVLSFPELRLLELRTSKVRISLPYVPGFLSFREAPAIVAAYNKLKIKPDIILFDGQGFAHPRRAGLACALGLILNKPTIGCAKTKLIGEYTEPKTNKGSLAPLFDNQQIIGYALRTKDNTKPVFVSPGHKTSFLTAWTITLACCTKYRIPEPLRYAHTISKLNKQGRLNPKIFKQRA